MRRALTAGVAAVLVCGGARGAAGQNGSSAASASAGSAVRERPEIGLRWEPYVSITNDHSNPRYGLRMTYALTPRLRLVTDASFGQKHWYHDQYQPPSSDGSRYHLNRFSFGEGIEGDLLAGRNTRLGVGGTLGVQQETRVSEVRHGYAGSGQTQAFVAPFLFLTQRLTNRVDLLVRAEDRFIYGQGVGGFTIGLRLHR